MTAFLLKLALGGLNLLKLIGSLLKQFFEALDVQGWIGLVAAVVLAVLLVREHGEARHWSKQSAQFEKLYRGEKLAHELTVANYRAAAEKARRDDAANKARVEAEQSAINERSAHDYEARIAAARAAARRLQQGGASATNPGSGGKPSVSSVSAAAGAVDAAAAQDRLSGGDALTATEQAIQLDAIQGWIRQQHAVDPNKKP
jgi:hypothetical protein